MTITEALALRDGSLVCHPAKLDYQNDGTPVKAPMRVTKVWVNAKQTIVQIRINGVAGQAWLDATGYELPPKGMKYDRQFREWVTPDELERRKQANAARV